MIEIQMALIPSEHLERARDLFERHGIVFEVRENCCVIRLPEGATRTELFPRESFSIRNRILLPDGVELREVIPDVPWLPPHSRIGFPDQIFS